MQRFAVIDTETTWGIYWNLAPLYGVQPILRILSGDDQYEETHNAYFDAMGVVSETQCIKDEIFAYMAESARRDCGVPESATVFW